jgi:hypothetical protein
MKYLLISVLLFSLSTFSQVETSSFPKKGLGINFSPAVGQIYRTKISNDVKYKPSFCVELGIQYDHQFNDKKGLYIGISFFEFVNRIEISNDTSNSSSSNPIYKETGTNKTFFIETPIGFILGKSLGKSRLFWDFSLIPGFDFFDSFLVKEYYVDGTVNELKWYTEFGVNTFSLAASTGVGWEYNFTEKMNLRIAPIFKSNILVADSGGIGFGAFWSVHLKLNFNLYFTKKAK